MGDIKLEIDTSRFNRALGEFALHSKKTGAEILLDQSRLFIQKAIRLTPPGQGRESPSAARKMGEESVKDDLHRIFRPKDPSYLEYLERIAGTDKVISNVLRRKDGTPYLIDFDVILFGRDSLVPFHEAHRSKTTGRVFKSNRDVTTGRRSIDQGRGDIAFVPEDNYAWFERRAIARVGVLASGWNKAALLLNAKVPPWIARHGLGRGDISIDIGSSGVMRVTVSNDVKFADGVKGLSRNIQRALNDQAEAMEKRVAYFLKHARLR